MMRQEYRHMKNAQIDPYVVYLSEEAVETMVRQTV